MYSELEAKALVKVLISDENLNVTKLSGLLNDKANFKCKINTLNKKINNNTLKYNEIREILKVLGYKIEVVKIED